MLRAILTAAALCVAASGAAAQSYDWRGILAGSVRVQAEFNLEFEVSKARQIPFYFTVGVPFSEGDLVTQTRFPEEGFLAEARFTTPDGRLLEMVSISSGTVRQGDVTEQMQGIFSVIDTMIYPSLNPPESAEVLGGREAEIGGYPAVEYLSLYNDPVNGGVAARIVGVLSPGGTNVLFFVQISMRDRLELAGPDELAQTFAGQMLGSLTFQGARDASGAMVEF